ACASVLTGPFDCSDGRFRNQIAKAATRRPVLQSDCRSRLRGEDGAGGLDHDGPMATTLQPVGLATHPYLSGRFAPVRDEVDVSGLTIEGALPDGLAGAYLRNGPNPMFPPLGSYTYPMEGDAMIHGVWFDGEGGVRYRNRWVRTKGMAADIAAGRD